MSVALTLALAGLGIPDARARLGLAAGAATRAGVESVHLDATLPGLRPRELDRSARRDLCAILRRHGVRASGLDLLIPASHFADPALVDRAAEAVRAAVALVAELSALGALGPGGRIVCVDLQRTADRPVAPGLLEDLGSHALSVDVYLVDLSGSIAQNRESSQTAHGSRADAASVPPGWALGVDVVALLRRQEDPAAHIARVRPACVRLGDVGGGESVRLGRGRLRLDAVAAACAVSAPQSPCVLDLRGVADDPAGLDALVEASAEAWRAAQGI